MEAPVKKTLISIAIACALATSPYAQDVQRGQQRTQTRQPQQPSQQQPSSQQQQPQQAQRAQGMQQPPAQEAPPPTNLTAAQIAAVLELVNTAEVEEGRFVQQRTQST